MVAAVDGGDRPGIRKVASSATSTGVPAVAQAVTRLGFEHLGPAGVPGREHLRRRSVPAARLRVMARDERLRKDDVLFRDSLITHPDAPRRYALAERETAGPDAGAARLFDTQATHRRRNHGGHASDSTADVPPRAARPLSRAHRAAGRPGTDRTAVPGLFLVLVAATEGSPPPPALPRGSGSALPATRPSARCP
ncbi:GrpB family protein [Streptomyces sp. NPDC014623]|uniref:GrpB family protein n=1 Tax=Streptomyces sp. NPDC014623 TaxID=3364875 RepID=UPI0036F5064D